MSVSGYDFNGNIPGLTRQDANGGDMDDLQYTYDNSNQLQKVKDHLGNVRTTFTTKPETEVFETSFETASVPEAYFDNYDEQNRDMSYSRTGTYSSRLSSTDNQLIGLAKSLKVYPGDTVNTKAYVRELAGTGGNINNLFTMLAQGFAGAFANTPIGLEGNLNSFSESLYPAAGTGGLMDKDDSDATPKLYLNMLYFDKDMNFITASFARSSSAATTGFEELNLEVVVPKEGYLLIYVSNEEEQANIAYFDDVNVTHKHSAVIQEESYYPFGMSQHYSYQRELTKEQRYLYNGKESISDLDLGWLDYGARMYMPELGRWNGIDIKADKYVTVSPYNYVLNNPIVLIDPDGKEVLPTNEAAYKAILNTLTAEDAAYVKLDKNGMIDKNLINTRKSESGNFNALLSLVNDERIVEVTVAKDYNIINTEGEIEGESLGEISYESEVEVMVELGGLTKEQAIAAGYSEKIYGSGYFGITIVPNGQNEEDGDGRGSVNGNINIFINPEATDRDQARTAAHEAFGHALFYILGKDSSHRGNLSGNNNIELENQIKNRVDETEQNFDKK
ncbi:hypothetical protein C9994_09310 [Marivirga lumbricoides]|uniref:RHS repeat-associated core domain-containing protein n=1 Tax=Marivirga lumbricoides TaxID=1046115 RepID=A0A2T4DQC5_9BACT|nr:hypothetical protein C9994_09310 [Marivirga lumbricoides]